MQGSRADVLVGQHRRPVIIALLVLLALVQAWDARLFRSTPPIIALVLLAITLPAIATLARARFRARAGAARIASPTPLHDLFVAAIPLWFISLMDQWLAQPGNGHSQGPTTVEDMAR